MPTLLCRARHPGEPADGREGTRGLRRVGDTLLTNGAAFKALVYCCPCGSVDSMLWAENAAALSLPDTALLGRWWRCRLPLKLLIQISATGALKQDEK